MATKFQDDLVAMIPHLRAFARSLTGSADTADDLVQDTIARALRAQHQYKPDTNLKAWLFTILRNQHISTMRRARISSTCIDDCPESLMSVPASQSSHMQLQDVQRAMMKLTLEHREALLLIGAAGVSYEEAAAICGCPVGTVKSRLSRARRELLELLSDTPHYAARSREALQAMAA